MRESGEIKILLVEDEPMWQQGISALLASDATLALVAVENDFNGALKAFQETHPDIVLLDWKILGEKDGLAVGEALTALGHPAERMILVTGSERSLIPANPYHYVPKHLIPLQLLETIHRIAPHKV